MIMIDDKKEIEKVLKSIAGKNFEQIEIAVTPVATFGKDIIFDCDDEFCYFRGDMLYSQFKIQYIESTMVREYKNEYYYICFEFEHMNSVKILNPSVAEEISNKNLGYF